MVENIDRKSKEEGRTKSRLPKMDIKTRNFIKGNIVKIALHI